MLRTNPKDIRAPKLNIGEIIVSQSIIGSGAYSTVFYGSYNEKSVALKVIGNQPEENTIYELNIMDEIQSANIVNLYGYFVNVFPFQDGPKNCYVIVMEYINGRSLHEIFKLDYTEKKHTLPFKTRYRGMREITAGIAYMHDKNISNNDIKDANILVSHTDHSFKLCDFGLSRFVNHNNSLKGSPLMMAPEMLLEYKTNSFNTDIYSLGFVYWNLLKNKNSDHFFLPKPKTLDELKTRLEKGERPKLNKIDNPKVSALIKLTVYNKSEHRPSAKKLLTELETDENTISEKLKADLVKFKL